jgi:hypothetical protein
MENSGTLTESSRRVVAMALVIGCHLGLLVFLLRPVNDVRESAWEVNDDSLAMKLRFILQAQRTNSQAALPASRQNAPPLLMSAQASGSATQPQPAKRATASPPGVSPNPSADPHPPAFQPTPEGYTEGTSFKDAGFQDQLHNAQRAHAVSGVPGSDRRLAPGINLINPMDQGIGAVVRKTQRLFGITNSHCIDVDVWRQLSPTELSARHISSRDVDRLDEKYGCNRPKGLSF